MSAHEKPAEQQVAEEAPASPVVADTEASAGPPPIDQKPFMDAIWPVLACGAGLFSDGYINNVSLSSVCLFVCLTALFPAWCCAVPYRTVPMPPVRLHSALTS